jgi:tetratricopeptide (TPR) repeat protein
LSADQRRELERLHQEGLEAFAKRDFDRAIRDWRAVWLEAPDFESVAENLIKAYLWEGVELYGRGEYDAALERCRRVLEIDPHNEKAKRYVERIQEEKAEVEQRRRHEP